MADTTPLAKLPLPIAALPEAIRRFCDPNGPTPGRLMAARGLVPVPGHDHVTMLAQLAADSVAEIRTAALNTLSRLPESVLHPACKAPVPPAVLEMLSEVFGNQQATLLVLVGNADAHDSTIERIARNCSELLSERIAVNETRLIRCPRIIESLYKNKNTRMSTADRLIELAARNSLDLSGIPAYKEHVEALRGQLIPVASDEPLPQDQAFSHTLAVDSDEDVFEEDAEGAEQVKSKFKPLSMQIMDMSKTEKIRMAAVGSKAARALLVRDHSKQVSYAAISSPQMTAAEAADIAKSKEVTEEILRYIGSKKDWIKNGEVKHNLVFNAKCPVGVSLKFIGHMRMDELRNLARNRNVSPQIRSLATQWVARKEKSGGG